VGLLSTVSDSLSRGAAERVSIIMTDVFLSDTMRQRAIQDSVFRGVVAVDVLGIVGA